MRLPEQGGTVAPHSREKNDRQVQSGGRNGR